MDTLTFPSEFIWGAATSAFQIEGATHEGGRGESIWDRFCQTPGHIANGDHAEVACDHFHRMKEDVALMAELGFSAYRFSIAWPRIQPEGKGPPHVQGLDFYKRLTDELLEQNIVPYATLYHWDLPQALQDQGGWPNRDTAKAFADYADAVTRALGDRVKHWFTHNEPWCAAILGYSTGMHAPGLHNGPAALAAAHHLLLSHGQSVPVIRANSPDCRVGIVLNLTPAYPASDSEPDRRAARILDGEINRWFLDPLHARGYPEDMVTVYRQRNWLPAGPIPFLQPGDFETIATACDFLGMNYYTRAIVRNKEISDADNQPRFLPIPALDTCTDMGWEVYPDGLYDVLVRLHRDYSPKNLLIAENGCSYPDSPGPDGNIHDQRRIQYFQEHLKAARRAIEDGVPLSGFFAWSLMDNFEWSFGYDKRFGLIWVDPVTQNRIPKDSAKWFRDRINHQKCRMECKQDSTDGNGQSPRLSGDIFS